MSSTEMKIAMVIIVLFCLFVLWLQIGRIRRQVKGKNIETAKRIIRRHGYECRVVEEDGREYKTSDNPSYNLYVRNGKVYRCDFGE